MESEHRARGQRRPRVLVALLLEMSQKRQQEIRRPGVLFLEERHS
jgi:hypothetical protein